MNGRTRLALLISPVLLAACTISSSNDDAFRANFETEGSDNVIDIRNGVACNNPGNCVAGYLGDCDIESCTIEYNTGNCEPVHTSDTYVAGEHCYVRTVECPDTSVCEPEEPMTDLPPPHACVNLVCDAGPIDACDGLSCTQWAQTGGCDLIRENGQYREECTKELVGCDDEELCTSDYCQDLGACPSGYVGDCDPHSCTQTWQTGGCVPDAAGNPTDTCETVSAECGDPSECEDGTTTSGGATTSGGVETGSSSGYGGYGTSG